MRMQAVQKRRFERRVKLALEALRHPSEFFSKL